MIDAQSHFVQHFNRLNEIEDLDVLREECKATLWYFLQLKALVDMGIKLNHQVPSSSEDGKESSKELVSDFGQVVIDESAGILVDQILGNEPNLTKAGLMIGVRGIVWLTELAADHFTSAEHFYINAVNHYDNKSYQESLENINKAIRKNKNYVDALCLRANIYSDLENFEYAIKDLNQIISIDPNCVIAYQKRAPLNYIQGNYSQAIQDEDFLVRQNVSDSQVHFRKAMSYIGLKLNEKALESLTLSIQRNPSHTLSYLVRAYLYLSNYKDYDKAVQEFKSIIRKDADCAEAYLGCAQAYEELKKYRDAIETYSQLINRLSSTNNIGMRKIAYAGRCLSYFIYALSYINSRLYRNAGINFSYSKKDYWSSHLRNKTLNQEIVKGQCVSYLSMNQKWRARIEAFLGGLNLTEIKELQLTKTEKFSMILLAIIVPISFNFIDTTISSVLNTPLPFEQLIRPKRGNN